MSVQILPNSIPKSTFRSILNSNFASLQNSTNVLSNSANFVLHNGNTRTENLLIGTNDNFNLNFETGGITRMTVLSGGNVGINTTSPNERLTVVGNISATGSLNIGSQFSASTFRASQGSPNFGDSSTTGYAFGGDGDTGLFSPIVGGGGVANGTLGLFTNNQERVRIETNVGINTTSPNERLTVSGNISATGNIAAQSSTIPVSVTSITTNRTFSDSDTNKVFHFSGSSPLSAIFPSSLSNGFNVALMNTGTSTLHLSTNSPYKAIGNVLTDQYVGAYVYKANSEIFAVGGF